MTSHESDPRMTTIHPRIRYNTIGGVNGPLVILDNVNSILICLLTGKINKTASGQIPEVQRDRVLDIARWHRKIRPSAGSSRWIPHSIIQVTHLFMRICRKSSRRSGI